MLILNKYYIITTIITFIILRYKVRYAKENYNITSYIEHIRYNTYHNNVVVTIGGFMFFFRVAKYYV